jgi:hypothetical protein
MAVSVQVIGERGIAIAPSATQIAVKDCVRPIAPKLDMIVPSLTGIPQHRSGRIFPHRLLLLLVLSFPPFLSMSYSLTSSSFPAALLPFSSSSPSPNHSKED